MVFDTPFPVLGRLPAADRLELVRSQPGFLEEHACPFAPHLQAVQVEHGFVEAALNLQGGRVCLLRTSSDLHVRLVSYSHYRSVLVFHTGIPQKRATCGGVFTDAGCGRRDILKMGGLLSATGIWIARESCASLGRKGLPQYAELTVYNIYTARGGQYAPYAEPRRDRGFFSCKLASVRPGPLYVPVWAAQAAEPRSLRRRREFRRWAAPSPRVPPRLPFPPRTSPPPAALSLTRSLRPLVSEHPTPPHPSMATAPVGP